MNEKRERDIEKILVDGLKNLGCISYKWVSPGQSGVPDRIVVLPGGAVVFVELKAENGRLTSSQKIQIRNLRSLDATVLVLKGEEQVRWFLEKTKGVIGHDL